MIVGMMKIQNVNSTMINKALILAASAHEGQTDRAGVNYMLHVLSVMHLLDDRVADDTMRSIALLHDVVEDTEVTFEDLEKYGFNYRVVSAVRALTKIKGQSLEEYKKNVFGNRDAMYVKLADLTHNSDMSRLKGKLSLRDLDRTAKYHQFISEINERLY